MVRVENVDFSEEFRQGDGIVAKVNGRVSIFYLPGILINDKYLVGKTRFVKDEHGNRNLVSHGRYKDIEEEVYGAYIKVKEDPPLCILNGIPLPWEIISLDDVLYSFSTEETFRHMSQDSELVRKLSENFPDTRFGIVGSSNVGLNLADSDIDIFIYNNYKNVIDTIRNNLGRFGLSIDNNDLTREIYQHMIQYIFLQEEAEEVCNKKLAGLNYNDQEVSFFDASDNPVLKWIFQPNSLEQVTVSGEVTDDSFAGHNVVSYDIEGEAPYSIALIRGIYPKEKRYIFRKGDSIRVSGQLVHTDPNVILAEDLNLAPRSSL